MLGIIRKSKRTLRIITYVLTLMLSYTPASLNTKATATMLSLLFARVSFADAISEGAALGEETATELNDAYSIPDFNNNTITITEGMGGDTVTVETGDVFPGISGDINDLTSVYGDEDDTRTLGMDAHSTLEQEDSEWGDAYRVMEESVAKQKPDMSNDPLWNLTDNTLNNLDTLSSEFGDCSSETTFNEIVNTTHVPEYVTCDRIWKPEGFCEITHNITIEPLDTDIVFLIDSTGSMQNAINALRDNVKAFARLLDSDKNNVRFGGAIYGDNKWYKSWGRKQLTSNVDDFRNWVGSIKANHSDENVFNAVKWSENYFSWRNDPDVHRVVVIIGNNEAYGDYNGAKAALQRLGAKTYIFHNVEKVKNLGKHVSNTFSGAKLLKLAQFLVVVEDSWTPQSCVDAALSIHDTACVGSIVQDPPPQQNCAIISGFEVCKGDPIYNKMGVPPIPDITKIASTVDVNVQDCPFNEGPMDCWIDSQGEEQCPTNDGDNLNSCQKYEEDPSCGFISSECFEDIEGEYSGKCYITEETWDCGYDVEVSSAEASTEYNCPGAISCMGTECVSPDRQASDAYGKAVSAAQAAQFVKMDSECNDLVCTVFSGEAYKCKVALGGIVDCCDKPSVNQADYLSLIMNMNKIDSMLTSDSLSGTAVQSGYEYLKNNASDAWTAVKKPFADAWNSLMGNSEAVASDAAKDTAVNSFKEEVMKYISDWVGETFGAEAKNALFNSSGTALGGTVGTFLVYIYYIYLIYMFIMLIIQLIWKCEDEEFELGVNRALGNCTKIGSYCSNDTPFGCIEKTQSYCCFKSPLSRIIQEQVRPQLGMSWGTKKSPQCDGIPTERLPEIDWQQVDLSEWLGMLEKNGILKNATNIDMESITGSGNLFDAGTGHEDAATRAQDRIDGLDTTEIRQDARDEVQSGYAQ